MRLIVSNISHRFAGRAGAVLDDVSMVAGAGRMLAITGPSGSGKSTLLSILGLILRPDRGEVRWGGLPISESRLAAQARAELFGWVTQTANIFGARTVLDNVGIGLLGRGFDHDTARRAATPVLEAVGLASRGSSRARVLSGGEIQRLTVARVILAGKPVLLADEPTGQLDRANTELVTQALRAAAERGAAVLIATHDPRVAAACDERLELMDGHVSWLS